VVFLLIPFLRFIRALQAVRALRVARVARVGGIVSAGVRGSRSAGRLLSSRIGWLAAVTVVVVLASSQLLYAFESQTDYTTALFEAALATVTGTGITTDDPFSQVLKLILAVYSVAVFATLAGSLGAFFLRDEDRVRVE
jgi:voltage-gated potassium channel